MKFINERAKALKQGTIRAMFDRANSMTDVISMGIGEPDFPTPEKICKAATEALYGGKTHYTANAGIMELRKIIAETSYLKGIHYDSASEIIITNGGMGALSLLMAVLLTPGDEVLVQDPQWLNYVEQIKYYGGVPVRVPTSEEQYFEMQPDMIRSCITDKTKALIINSPNNPTGCVMSPETMKKIADIAIEKDLLIISDEIYNTLLYDNIQVNTIAAMPGMKERTIVVNSFSKSFAMTGWRIGFATGPSVIIDRLTKCQEYFNSCVSSASQWGGVYALQHPELAEDLRKIFEHRRNILVGKISLNI